MVTKKVKMLISMVLFCIMVSCNNYKTNLQNKFFLYCCNYTDKIINVEVLLNNQKSLKIQVPAYSAKVVIHKIHSEKFDSTGKLQITFAEEKDEPESYTLELSENVIYSYSAYGGLCTRINVKMNNNNSLCVDFSDDWDHEPQLKWP